MAMRSNWDIINYKSSSTLLEAYLKKPIFIIKFQCKNRQKPESNIPIIKYNKKYKT